MKAAQCVKYGAPELLQINEVEKPQPKDNEVLIKIHASTVSSGDARMRRADPFIIRLIFGFKAPRKSILGIVVAGEIEAIGKTVTKFKVGDKVFGSTGMRMGAHAEYTTVPEKATLVIKPGNISYEEAASIPFGGTSSLHFLKKAKIQAGQKVLVYGASGALGTTAVQLSKAYGAEVTAISSSSNHALMKSLGADHVIDYKKEDFTQNGEYYDVIYDTVGKSPFWGSLKSLNQKGYYLMASGGLGKMIWSSFISPFIRKKILSGVVSETVKDMQFLSELVQKEKLKAVIDKTYSLDQIAAAHAHVDTGHKIGNVIVRMDHAIEKP